MLKADGRIIGDFTLANLGDHWLITGSGVAEDYHMRWVLVHLPADGSVTVEAVGQGLAGLHIAGPKARAVLEAATGQSLDTEAFPFLTIRRLEIGTAPALVGRISYTGDLGYEIWLKPEYQRAAYRALWAAGRDQGIGNFGMRALNALRLEKGYGAWARDYRPIYSPVEARLDRFVALGKPCDFIGKAAAAAEKAGGGKLRLVSFAVEARDADVIGDEPIWKAGAVVGWVTSGGYAHASATSVALGYVPKTLAGEDDGLSIELLGERLPARRLTAPLFDANGSRMRS
jgi:dimethylglycine dehydrogenase